MWEIKVMTYQNFILTVIAVGLLTIAIQGLGSRGATAQQSASVCGMKDTPCHVIGVVGVHNHKYAEPLYIATKRSDRLTVVTDDDQPLQVANDKVRLKLAVTNR